MTIQNQINASCYGLTGTAANGLIDVAGAGGTGFYHYYLEVFTPPNNWSAAGNTPGPNIYTGNPVTFINMEADSFRVRTIEGVSIA